MRGIESKGSCRWKACARSLNFSSQALTCRLSGRSTGLSLGVLPWSQFSSGDRWALWVTYSCRHLRDLQQSSVSMAGNFKSYFHVAGGGNVPGEGQHRSAGAEWQRNRATCACPDGHHQATWSLRHGKSPSQEAGLILIFLPTNDQLWYSHPFSGLWIYSYGLGHVQAVFLFLKACR